MVAPAPAPKAKKTIDQCLAEFHGCMTTSTLAPAPAPTAGSKAAPAPAPASIGLMTRDTPSTAAWVKSGYKLVKNTSVPTQFRLKNAVTGQYMIAGPNNTIAEGAGAGVVITRTPAADIYKNTATTGIYMMRLDTPAGAIRHSEYVLYANPYTPNNLDFAWHFLLKDGTTNRIIIWNPYPGDAQGMYLTGGTRPKISAAPPTEYIIEKATAGSGTSGYTLEGSPYGAVMGSGRNTKLILTLLVLTILLWILAKKM